MTKIYHVSGLEGIQLPTRKGFTLMNRDVEDISEGELSLMIARDNMVAKRDIVARKRGIGAIRTQKFQNTIDVLDDALHGLGTADPVHYMALIEEDILNGVYSIENEVHGIGCPVEIGKIRAAKTAHRRKNRAAKMHTESVSGIGAKKKASAPKTKTGSFIKKAAQKTGGALKNVAKKTGGAVKTAAKATGKVVKKVAKGAVKVATAPARLAVKLVLEILLPQAAPFFLYLFINDPAIIAKLPAKVAAKRAKALRIKNFIVNVIGMKDAHFMGIVRNGIMKKMGASPETILSGVVQKVSGIGGIGVVGVSLAVAAKAAPFVIQIIQKLVAAFKKNKEAGLEPSESDAPSDKDWEGMVLEKAVELSTGIKKQNDLPEPGEEKTESLPTRESFSKSESSPASSQNESSSNAQGGGSSNNQSSSQSNAPIIPEGSFKAETAQAEGRPGAFTDTDESGEIKKSAGGKDEFATGGRKGWNSLGN